MPVTRDHRAFSFLKKLKLRINWLPQKAVGAPVCGWLLPGVDCPPAAPVLRGASLRVINLPQIPQRPSVPGPVGSAGSLAPRPSRAL